MKTDKIFYTPTIQPNDTIFTLNEEESSHAIKVLRMKTNDEVTLIDGIGGVYEGTIVNPHHKRCEIEIKQYTKEFEKREFYLHIAIAPTKMNERMEWFLEKCTEIGIDEITPILCHHSERKELKIERMNKIIISAMKQSKKAYLPRLNEMTPIKTLVENATEEEWAEHFREPLRTGRVPGETLDFFILVPLAEKAEKGEWKKSKLEDVKQYILEQM